MFTYGLDTPTNIETSLAILNNNVSLCLKFCFFENKLRKNGLSLSHRHNTFLWILRFTLQKKQYCKSRNWDFLVCNWQFIIKGSKRFRFRIQIIYFQQYFAYSIIRSLLGARGSYGVIVIVVGCGPAFGVQICFNLLYR